MATCEETFGIFPCSTSVVGSFFLVVVYGIIIFKAAGCTTCLPDHLPKPLSGILTPTLGAVPLVILVLSATLPGNSEVLDGFVGVGMLVGQSLMLSTLAWGGVLCVARTQLDTSSWLPGWLSRWCPGWANMGVAFGDDHRWQAVIMMASAALYICVMVPGMAGFGGMRVVYLVCAALSFLSGLAYCLYQALGPGYWRYRQEERCHRHLRYNTVRALSYYANRYGGILTQDATVNWAALARIFQHFDRNKDGLLSRDEVYGMLVGMDFAVHAKPGQHAAIVDYWMAGLDKENTGFVNEERFCQVLQPWFTEKLQRFGREFPMEPPKEVVRSGTSTFWWMVRKAPEDYCIAEAGGSPGSGLGAPGSSSTKTSMKNSLSASLLEDNERDHSSVSVDVLEATASTSDVVMPSPESSACNAMVQSASGARPALSSSGGGARVPPCQAWVLEQCPYLALLWAGPTGVAVVFGVGSAVCAVFAQPFARQLVLFTEATHAPTVVVVMVAVPLVTTGRQLLHWLNLAGSKHGADVALVMYQVAAAVTVCNTLCLGCLLLALAVRNAEWRYPFEVSLAALATLVVSAMSLRAGPRLPALLGAALVCAYPLVLLVAWLLESPLDTLRGM